MTSFNTAERDFNEKKKGKDELRVQSKSKTSKIIMIKKKREKVLL